MAEQLKQALIRRREVEQRTGLSRSPLYARIKAGTFPKPVNLGSKAVAWVESEVDAWVTAQIENSRKA